MSTSRIKRSEVKENNIRVFGAISKLLASDEEKDYLAGSGKITKYISAKEAYYPQALRIYPGIFKTARETLTRLSGSSSPFRLDNSYPAPLEERVQAYVKLVQTASKFRGLFAETDVETSDLLKDIWSSIEEPSEEKEEESVQEILAETDQCDSSSAEVTPDQVITESAQDSSIETIPQQNYPTPPPTISRKSASSIPAPIKTSISMSLDTPTSTKSPLGIASPLTTIRTSLAKKRGASPSVSRPPTPQVVANSPLGTADSSYVPTEMAYSVSTEQVPVNANVNEPDATTIPTIPETPAKAAPAAAPEGTSRVQPPAISESTPMPTPLTSTAAAAGKLPRPKKKLKLGKNTALLSLVKQDDIDWWKQQAASSPTVSSPGFGGASKTPPQSHILIPSVSQPTTPCVVTTPKQTDLPTDASLPMDVDDAPVEAVQVGEVTESLPPAQSEEDVTMTESAPEGPVTHEEPIVTVNELKDVQPEPIPQESENRPLQTTLQTTHDGSVSPSESYYKPLTKNIALALGDDTGASVTMKLGLDTHRRERLELWQSRGEHMQDVSTSLCVSLACYRITDFAETGIVSSFTNNLEVDPSQFAELKASWPRNSRLEASIGEKRVFLSPPLDPTAEGFVDISRYVDGDQVDVTFTHACDMREFVYAMLVHAPTPSQLSYLEERRTKEREWKAFLADLSRPFTVEEIFSPKIVQSLS